MLGSTLDARSRASATQRTARQRSSVADSAADSERESAFERALCACFRVCVFCFVKKGKKKRQPPHLAAVRFPSSRLSLFSRSLIDRQVKSEDFSPEPAE